jgi:hypothetical protein
MNTPKLPLFIIKWTNYEYWPWWFFYIPLLPYWFWLSIKTKSFAFFSATNTNIELGGFFGESKIDILKQISPTYLPTTFPVKQNLAVTEITNLIEQHHISFPLIVKPNVGERGNDVEKINSFWELQKYHVSATFEYIIQEFIDFEIELGVLFYRLPNEENGVVSSVAIKEFLTVTGDGKSTILQLMKQNTRARFQIKSIKNKLGESINDVLSANKKILLEPIGNHCRGTRFINGNYLINDKLHEVFNVIVKNMSGFHYGRFDLKVKSITDLYEGENIKIMELNGASSEPGHIYDASVGIFNAYKTLGFHWNILSKIAIQNKKKGIKPVAFTKVISTFYNHFAGL